MPSSGSRYLIPVCLMVLLPCVVRADKLVHFQNGRVLRVVAVRQDDAWYTLSLGRRATMGVPAVLVARIDDIADDSVGSVALPNVQSAAGGTMRASVPRRPTPPSVRAVPSVGVARPAGVARVSPAARPTGAADARARADALAVRGRTVSGNLGALRSPAGRAANPAPTAQPAGSTLEGGASAWPSLLDKNRTRRPATAGRRDGDGSNR
ncbi:MAG: hypothetical protein ACE5IK_09385 [Acidobacteriota bacterium]